MNAELLSGFELEISALSAQLSDERTQLEEVPEDCNPEIVAMARDRFALLEDLIRKISEARASILLAEAEAVDRARRYVQWRAAVRDVIVARARLEEFVPLIRQAQEKVDQGEAALTSKQAALTTHLNHPLAEPNFAAPAKIKAWDATKKTLEANLAEQSRTLGDAKIRLQRLHLDSLSAQDALFARPGGLLFRADQLAPRVPQKEQGVGVRSAVN
jgi:hypothetical protein